MQRFVARTEDQALADLQQRLALTRWPDALTPGWERGVDIDYLRRLIAFWRERFDWRATENAINRFPQFRAEVDGVSLHFIHVRGRGPNPMPLILTHGWPSRPGTSQ